MFFQFCGTMVQKCIALLMTLLMNLGAAVSAVIQPISLPTLAQSASTYTVGNLTVQLDLGDGSYTVAHKGITIFRWTACFPAAIMKRIRSTQRPCTMRLETGLKSLCFTPAPLCPTCGRIFCFMRGGITCSPRPPYAQRKEER